MNLNDIRKSTTCTWDKEDDVFIATSPLCANVKGFGDTAQEALQMQEEMLAEVYNDYLAGKFTPKVIKAGRPKGNAGKAVSVRLLDEELDYLRQLTRLTASTQTKVFREVFQFYMQHHPEHKLS